MIISDEQSVKLTNLGLGLVESLSQPVRKTALMEIYNSCGGTFTEMGRHADARRCDLAWTQVTSGEPKTTGMGHLWRFTCGIPCTMQLFSRYVDKELDPCWDYWYGVTCNENGYVWRSDLRRCDALPSLTETCLIATLRKETTL